MDDAAQSAALAAYSFVTPAAFRTMAERCGGRAHEAGGVLVVEGPDPAAEILNCAFRLTHSTPGEAVLDAALSRFTPRRYAFTIWSQSIRDRDLDAAAAAAGWEPAIELPAMVVAAPVEASSVAGAVLRVAATAADREAFARIAAETLGEGEDDRRAYRSVLQAPDLFRSNCRAVILSVDDRDAAVAWIVVIDRVGLVGWVGTLEPYRRRGLGAIVTSAVTNAGFALGAQLVALQASPMGQSVYGALGFRTIAHETLWVPPRATA